MFLHAVMWGFFGEKGTFMSWVPHRMITVHTCKHPSSDGGTSAAVMGTAKSHSDLKHGSACVCEHLCAPGIGFGLGKHLQLNAAPAKHLSPTHTNTHQYTHSCTPLTLASLHTRSSDAYHALSDCFSVVSLSLEHTVTCSEMFTLVSARSHWFILLHGGRYCPLIAAGIRSDNCFCQTLLKTTSRVWIFFLHKVTEM